MSPSDHPPKAPGAAEAPPPSYSILKFIVIFLGILLVGGFAILAGTIAYRLANPAADGEEAAQSAAETGAAALVEELEIALPVGSRIVGHDLDGARLALHLEGAPGREIWIVDLESGTVVSRIRLDGR